MALEVMKTSAYQTNISPAAKPINTGGPKSVEQVVEQDDRETSASEQHIKSEISKANNKLRYHNTKCEFGYHEETRRVTIKVLDKDTEEVIREIPPEKTLEMIEKMWELAGLMVDERR
jgi:flagellar protein FlaG